LAAAVIGVAAIAIATASLAPSRVTAHAAYDRSQPAADAVVRTAPAQVDVWFTQEMFRREGENTLSVIGPNGQPVNVGSVTLDSEDRTHLFIALNAGLGPGEYVVSWATLSAVDGDTAEGEFRFTVDPSAPEATATPAAKAEASASEQPDEPGVSSILAGENSTAFPWWLLLAGAAVAASTALTVRAVREPAESNGPPQ
jgi:methionine-rich copper-binding protein CopC